jgi:hypothetical protein
MRSKNKRLYGVDRGGALFVVAVTSAPAPANCHYVRAFTFAHTAVNRFVRTAYMTVTFMVAEANNAMKRC